MQRLWETGVAGFHPLALCVSVFSAVGWAHTQLCALAHPLPPKWEIINTHQSNTRSHLEVHKVC